MQVIGLRPSTYNFSEGFINILITPTTSIVDLSFTEGSFTSHFKSALVSPLLKKLCLHKDSMKKLPASVQS